MRLGVYPAREHSAREALFRALEEAYPVRFEGREAGAWDGLDGALMLGAHTTGAPPDLPSLRALGQEREMERPSKIRLSSEPVLARPLHGAGLTDGWVPPLERPGPSSGELVLAKSNGRPAWVATAGAPAMLVSAFPEELAEGEALRERLSPGRCLALLALVQFLRALLDGGAETALPQASFVLDDPNLHWPSYGHVRYEELARHALEHGYHVAVAMVPLDGWLAHPRVVRIFRDHPGQLSICVHGNDHQGPELGRVSSNDEGAAIARQALQRVKAFEGRTGIPVDRVMVPPHEKLSEPAAQGLRESHFEAVCVSRPYPWIVAPAGGSPLIAPPERGALAGWTRREIVAGGLPLLLRAGFNSPREDLILRAFLGQPLILYGHHDLLENGLDVLSEAAGQIKALGDVRWVSLKSLVGAGPNATGAAQGSQLDLGVPARARIAPLVRRLVSEGRDRVQALGAIPFARS